MLPDALQVYLTPQAKHAWSFRSQGNSTKPAEWNCTSNWNFKKNQKPKKHDKEQNQTKK